MKGREGMEGEGLSRGGEGKRGEEGVPEREGEERGPHDPLAWGPQCLNPALIVRLTSRRAGWAIYHIRLLIFSDRSFSSIFYVIVYGVVPSCVLCLYVLF